MKTNIFKYFACFILLFCIFSLCSLAWAQKKPADPISLKLEGAKMAPVPFSHPVHIEKAKIDCAACHHKDKNPKEPVGCLQCHQKETKDNVADAKKAFHKQCITCHKESTAKGVTAPVKCNECHKK
ncbi:MAG: cytochrome C3 subunit A [Syntrophus sp. (in: bacteria)]|nr:cytochrome C3 subunit A [Syntrophus sp. (in: bacteria)]